LFGNSGRNLIDLAGCCAVISATPQSKTVFKKDRLRMNRKIISYQVVESASLRFLQVDVKDLIADGWQPVGGLVVSNAESSAIYCQAMVQYE